MLKKIALLSLFLAVVFSACTVGSGGCTACNSDKDPACTKCDETKYYFLKDGACVFLDKCIGVIKGVCNQCDDKKFYFLKDDACAFYYGCAHTEKGACTTCQQDRSYFPKTENDASVCKLLNNCKIAVDQKCTVCADAVKTTHSIQQGECLKTCEKNQKHNADKTDCVADIENVNNIVGCTAKAEGADTDNKCKTCKTGTTLAISTTKCITNVKDCQTYNDTGCDKCKTGFKLNTTTQVCDVDKSSSSSSSSSAIVSASLAVILAVSALAL